MCLRTTDLSAATLAPLGEEIAPARTRGDHRRLPPTESRLPDGAWHVAHTRPRQEKALGDALDALGVACFVPLVRQVRYYGHRHRVASLPLFPSYVFVHGPKEHALLSLRTKRVARIIPVADQTALEHELLQIDRALLGGAALDPYPYLEVGKRVVVVRGPFKGLEGMVDARKSPDRLALNVSILGRATSLEIDASLLEPID